MVSIRKRGKVYQYSFEIAKVDGKRRRKSKSGFKTKKEAIEAGERQVYICDTLLKALKIIKRSKKLIKRNIKKSIIVIA